MQVTDAGNKSRVGVNKELINFQLSSNLNNMKKFLRNRNTETMTTASYVAPLLEVSPQQNEQTEVKPVFQPPLPTYPPPPDSPPILNIVIKQEKEDIETLSPTPEDGGIDSVNNEEQAPTKQLHVEPEKYENNGPKRTMCKEWVRGDCKRPICRFSHELDLTQLRGVYTFCWNYQNDKCSYPHCKFVHASIFEEAEFYRTGSLPAHARTHLKKPSAPQPLEEIHSNIQSNYTNPPPIGHTGIDKIGVIVPPMEQKTEETFTRNSSPLKREWNEVVDDFSSSPGDKDHSAKKCKNCGILEFRLQYNKEKIENMIEQSDEMNNKMTLLIKKSSKLSLVLQTIMKSTNKCSIPNTNEKEKFMAEQLSSIINASKLSSVINDKSSENLYGANISNLMAKIGFYMGGEQALSSDTARET